MIARPLQLANKICTFICLKEVMVLSLPYWSIPTASYYESKYQISSSYNEYLASS